MTDHSNASVSEHRLDETYARELDAGDTLAPLRNRFELSDRYYMDGNSLGPLSDDAWETLDRAIEQWRTLGIKGWTEAEPPWFWYGERLGDRLAGMIGADPTEVVVGNSTTVNIHTLIGTFLEYLDGDTPPGILANELDFPTDHYAMQAQLRQRGYDPAEHLHLVESHDGRTIATEDIVTAMDEHDVGIVFMPSVLYRSGQLFDIERITDEAHERGVLVGFDLAHSIGVVPHDLSGLGVDFAVWCTYKYLNGGPGSIAGLYVNERHFDASPSLAGWWGHDKETQFELNLEFTPAEDAGAWQIGTIPILSAAPLFGSINLIEEVGVERIRAKSLELTSYLMYLIDERLADRGCAVGTPREPDQRGGHVSMEHPEAEALSLALRERGVIVDFRPPNVIRVCPAPLYCSFQDVYDVVEITVEILDNGEHEPHVERIGEDQVT